ncbi:MAG: single-stranded DNA-binding protein [Chloroflexota bacterium]|nr:single-stranded DNA-binding protein [Chloroflexota bacterium]
MAGWHQTIIVGNVGKDPEMKYLQSGSGVCNFSVAVSRKYTTNGEQRDETTWYRVAVWNKLAETANQYVRKGTQIMVVGRISVRAYMGNDGTPQASIELNADSFQLLGGRGDAMASGGNGGGQQAQGEPYGGAPQNDSEIPF